MRWSRETVFRLVLTALLVLPLSLIGYKLFVLHYPLTGLIPAVSYRIDLGLQVDGHGEKINVTTFLPRSDLRQQVSEEQNSSGPFALALLDEAGNRVATWSAANLDGRHNLLYSFSVIPRHLGYLIPPGLKIPVAHSPTFAPYLEATAGIQVFDPLVERTLRRLLPKENPEILEALTAIHRYLQDQLENRDFSGYTDAVTALKLGEASCNGKSRLFAAFARRLNLPTRLVGGLILEQGSKRVSHQWVEVYVNGHWVPFDTINDHFAEIPANFLTLYYGDQVLFKHTPNVNFQYFYKMTRRLVPQQEVRTSLQNSPLNILNLYALFEQVGISQNLLKIILMLPFGALVTALLRNVVGLQTFGTFLPALIAAAARETEFWWGIFGFLAIIIIAALIERGLESLQLLHAPRMAILFTVVIICMLGMAVIGVRLGNIPLAHITLFPVAILTITAERFAQVQIEHGLASATKRMLMTILAVGACYAVMSTPFLQNLILVFPELLLLLIAANLWLGKWVGLRVSEFRRFRQLLRTEAS